MPEHLWFLRRIRIDVVEPFLDDQRGRPRHLVQRSGGDRGRTALVAPGRPRRPRRGRQRLDPSRPGSAAGQDRGLRHLRRRRRRPAGLDEAGAARSTGGRRRPPVAAACERHRPPRPRQQRRLLAGRRARAPVGRHRPGPSARRRARLPRADRPRRRDRAGRVERRRRSCWPASAPRTGSGRWRGWVSDSVAPGGALCLPVAGALLAADRALVDAVALAGDEVDVAGADLRLADDPRIGPRRGSRVRGPRRRTSRPRSRARRPSPAGAASSGAAGPRSGTSRPARAGTQGRAGTGRRSGRLRRSPPSRAARIRR